MDYGLRTVEETGAILKSLTPTSIAVLLFVIDDTIDKQVEMADRLDCTSAPISLSLQSLSELSNPLVTRDRDYRITETGEMVVSEIDQMMLALGVDLCDIDWADNDEKGDIDSALRPLHNSRSLMPFYVLDSISRHADGSSTVIETDQIVDDVRERKLNSEETVTKRQVKHAIDRFEKEDAINVDDNEVTVTKKGHEQARLFDQLADFLSNSGSTSGDEPYKTGRSAEIVSKITIGELSDQIQRLEDQYGRDQVIELRWTLGNNVNTPMNENSGSGESLDCVDFRGKIR